MPKPRKIFITNRTGAGFLKTADEMEINRLAAARMRTRRILEQIDKAEDLRDSAIVNNNLWLEDEVGTLINKYFDEIIYLYKHLDKPVEKKDSTYTSITDYDIEQANNFPIDHLILFVNGKAYAWCHDDKTPSLVHWKKENRARCFVCDKTYRPIDVLMERDSLSFVQAVKRLG